MTTANCEKSPEVKSASGCSEYVRPSYTADSDESAYYLRVNVPGVDKSGVHASVKDDVLTVTGNRAHTVPEEWKPLRRELRVSNYRLQVRLNVPVDADGIEAKIEHGVLNIRLPLSDAAKTHTIAIG